MRENKFRKKRVTTVEDEINRVEPILENAKRIVSKMTVTQLDEICKYNNPSRKIKKTLEAVCYLLEGKKMTWKQISSRLNNGNFISSILKFKLSKKNSENYEFVKKNYLGSKEWNVKSIYKASRAVGPLADWLSSLVQFVEVKKKLIPIKKELKK